MTSPSSIAAQGPARVQPTVELVGRLWRLLPARDRKRLALGMAAAALLALLEAVSVGLVPLFVLVLQNPAKVAALGTQWLGAAWVPAGDRLLVTAAAALVAAYAAKSALGLAVLSFQARFLCEQQDALTARLLRGYVFAPYSLHLAKSSSAMVRTVLGESGIVMSTMLTALLTVFGDICVGFLVAALLIAAQPLVAVGTVAVFALLSWSFYRAVRGRVARLSSGNVEHGKAALRWITQALAGIKEIKVTGREAFFLEAGLREARGSNAAAQSIALMNNVPRYFNEGVAVVAMVLLALAMSGSGAADVVPTLVLFAVAATRVIPSFNRIVTSLTSFRYGEAALRSVESELRIMEVTPPSSPAPGGAHLHFESLQIAGLRFRYSADAAFALELPDLRIEPGRKIAFVGPSGSGKTTLVDLMLGLHRASPGMVRVNGRDVSEVLGAWRASVGYIPQSIFLLDDTIRRNVAFGVVDADVDARRVNEALAAAQLDGLVAELPAGVDTEVGDRGVRLSGGQRQRIGIARALYWDPQVLILDEGTAALDNVTEAGIVRAINALAGRKTIIMIAHRLSTVQSCDRIHFMQDGRIIAAGTYDDLRGRLPEFQAMLNVGAELNPPQLAVGEN